MTSVHGKNAGSGLLAIATAAFWLLVAFANQNNVYCADETQQPTNQLSDILSSTASDISRITTPLNPNAQQESTGSDQQQQLQQQQQQQQQPMNNPQLQQQMNNPQIPQQMGNQPPQSQYNGGMPQMTGNGSPPPMQENGGPPQMQGNSGPPQMQMQGGNGPPQMQGNGPPQMQGNGPPQMQGNGSPQMQGNGPPQMQGNVPPQMQGNGPPKMGGVGNPLPFSNEILQSIQNYSKQPLFTGQPSTQQWPLKGNSNAGYGNMPFSPNTPQQQSQQMPTQYPQKLMSSMPLRQQQPQYFPSSPSFNGESMRPQMGNQPSLMPQQSIEYSNPYQNQYSMPQNYPTNDNNVPIQQTLDSGYQPNSGITRWEQPSSNSNMLPFGSMINMVNPLPYVKQTAGMVGGMANKYQKFGSGVQKTVNRMVLDAGSKIIKGKHMLLRGMADVITALPESLMKMEQQGLDTVVDLIGSSPLTNMLQPDSGNRYQQQQQQPINNNNFFNPRPQQGGIMGLMGNGGNSPRPQVLNALPNQNQQQQQYPFQQQQQPQQQYPYQQQLQQQQPLLPIRNNEYQNEQPIPFNSPQPVRHYSNSFLNGGGV